MSHDLLAIYLTDHLAGATAGSRRMRRLAKAEGDAADSTELSRVADEVEEDRSTLMSVVENAGVSPRWYKTAIASLGERVGLLKTNGAILHRSPLTSLVELEAMRMGVTAKLCLWGALRHTELSTSFDLDDLIQRAQRQLGVLEDAHSRRAMVVSQRDASGPVVTTHASAGDRS